MDEVVDITDHVVVSVSLTSRYGECSPEIEEEVIYFLCFQIVECDSGVSQEIVEQVACPSQSSISAELVVGLESDCRNGYAEPCVEQVVTLTRNNN